jgi:hypothetical protein
VLEYKSAAKVIEASGCHRSENHSAQQITE